MEQSATHVSFILTGQGLQSVLARYFETLKKTIGEYLKVAKTVPPKSSYKNEAAWAKDYRKVQNLINGKDFEELCKIF